MTNIDPIIIHPLERLRGGIRSFVLRDGLLVAALIVVVGYWLGLAFDYGAFKLFTIDWVLDAPKALRVVGLLAFVALLAACVGYLWYYRLTRTFSHRSLALVLEKRFPEQLGDKLITAVELADVEKAKQSGYSAAMLHETIEDARKRVGEVPIEKVFNTSRLRNLAGLLVAIVAGLLFIAFLIYFGVTRSFAPISFVADFTGVSSLWGSRNLLLSDTPWPRRAHLEFVDFPTTGELRIGKDAPAPTIKVRAYQWVIKEPGTRMGWRPLSAGDLRISDRPERLVDGDSALETTADEMQAQFNGRVRKLIIPDTVTLRYAGRSIRGTIQLNRQNGNEFAGEIAGLKESIQFFVRGEDFASETQTITLVPPPMLLKLSRDEFAPAYLYHPAPNGDYGLLKGLRHEFKGKDFSLAGEKSSCVVLTGTELTVRGQADKKLKEIRVSARAGKVPGTTVGAKDPLMMPPSNGDSFAIEFKGDHKLTATTEFDLTLVDPDGVTSTRTVTLAVVDDQPPIVELGVDVLRKRGNEYLCTPIARVPFLVESFIRDDHALSKVEYQFSYVQVDAKEVVALQSQMVMGMVAGAPLPASPGTAISPIAPAMLLSQMMRANRTFSESAPVPRFVELQQSLPAITTDLLKQRLTQPVDLDRPDVVKEVKLLDAGRDAFDLEKYLPKIRVSDPTAVQPQYRVEFNIVATDANVDSGPKTGRNLEPVRLMVISEADLLAEISKDEEGLIVKLDDTIKKLKAAQAKLGDLGDRLTASVAPADLLASSSVKATDIAQDISKSRDQTIGILTEYKRLYREAETNRCGRNVLDRLMSSVIGPLEDVNQKQFPEAEEAHRLIADELANGRKPVPLAINADRTALLELIVRLDAIRASLGDALSTQKLQEELRRIIGRQEGIKKAAVVIKDLLIKRLFAPELRMPAAVTVDAKKSITVKIPIDWKLYDKGDLTLTAVADGGVMVPMMLSIKDDKDEIELPVTALDKPGEYRITVTPAVGAPVVIVVTVK
jgi:hypothetical protein